MAFKKGAGILPPPFQRRFVLYCNIFNLVNYIKYTCILYTILYMNMSVKYILIIYQQTLQISPPPLAKKQSRS